MSSETDLRRLDESLNATHGVYFSEARLIASARSAYQHIEVFDTPDLGRLMRIDGANMVSERDEFLYHEALVHPAALLHPNPTSALIIGGGDGGGAEELLKHPSMAHCVICELDEAVVQMAKQHLGHVHQQVFSNPRLTVRIGEGLAYLASVDQRFDLIFMDLTDPHGAVAALYSREAYSLCARALHPPGVMVAHLGSPFSHPARVRATLENLRAEFRFVWPYFVHIPMYGALWGFALASQESEAVRLTPSSLDASIAERGIRDLQWATGHSVLAASVLPPYVLARIS